MGYAAVVGLLQLWNFVAPIDGRAYFALVPLAGAGFILGRSRLRSAVRPPPALALVGCAATLGVTLLAARLAMSKPDNPDTCVYFIESIRWFARYHATPGLGNLNLRLGFNHGFYLFAALFEAAGLGDRGEHIPSGLLTLGLIAPAALTWVRLFDLRAHRASDYLLVMLGGAFLASFLSRAVSNPQADLPIAALDAICIHLALAPRLDGEPFTADRLRVLAIVSCAALVSKLSAVIMVLPMGVFATYEAWRCGALRSTNGRYWAAAAGLLLVIAGAWMARGIVPTGYPLFPSKVGSLDVDWRVPAEIVDSVQPWVLRFARMRTTAYLDCPEDYPWIMHWLSIEWPENREFFVPALVAAVGLVVALVSALMRRRASPATLALVPIVVSLTWWFRSAPAVRFAEPMLWSAAVVAVLLALGPIRWEGAHTGPVAYLMLVSLVVLTVFSGVGPRLPDDFEPAGPETTTPGRLGSGEPIQISAGCCLNPPCAPASADHVRLRVAGDFSAGFSSAAENRAGL